MKKLLFLLPLAGCNIPPQPTFTPDQVQSITAACTSNGGYILNSVSTGRGVYTITCTTNGIVH